MSWLHRLMNANLARQVAQQFLQFLLAQRKFAEAAELCPELLKVSQYFAAQLVCVVHGTSLKLFNTAVF